MNLHVWTPDSGTVELPRVHRGIPLADAPTSELHLLDLRPSVPRRVERPSRLRRLFRSPLARHVRAAARSTFWPTVVIAGYALGIFLLHLVQVLTPVTAIR